MVHVGISSIRFENLLRAFLVMGFTLMVFMVCDLDEISIVCVRSRRDLNGTLVKVSHLVEIRQQLVAECLP
jgi:hypothetical protein